MNGNALLTPQQLWQICQYLRTTGCIPTGGAGGGSTFVGRGGVCLFPVKIVFDAKGRIIQCVSGTVPPELNCLNEFLVAPDPDCAPFTSIQEAYDAAVAAGFGPDKPTQINVCPGTYTENLSITTMGIDIIAIAGDEQQPFNANPTSSGARGNTIVVGTVEIVPTAGPALPGNNMMWRGIDILPLNVVGLVVDGGNPGAVTVADCRIAGLLGVEMNNPGTLDLKRCVLENRSAASACWVITNGNCFASMCGFTVANSGGGFRAITVEGTGALRFENCICIGEIFAEGTGIVGEDSEIIGVGTLGAIRIDGVGAVTLTRSSVESPPGINTIQGDGTFVYNSIDWSDVDTRPWDTTLSVTAAEGLPAEQEFKDVALPFTITNQISLGPVGPGTITLPPLAARVGVIRLKEASTSAGAVTVAASGAELIRIGTGAPTATIALPRPNATNSGGVFLVPNEVGGFWEAFTIDNITCLEEFLVSPDPACAPFQSIQAAYDAAVAAGHDDTNPATVLVCAGDYTEDVLMDTPGIDIVAVSTNVRDEQQIADRPGITRLLGELTIDLSAAATIPETRCTWAGIDIIAQAAATPAVTSGGTATQFVEIRDCQIDSLFTIDADTILVSNQGNPSQLNLVRVAVFNNVGPNGTQPAPLHIVNGDCFLNDCLLRHTDGGPSFVVDSTGGVLVMVGSQGDTTGPAGEVGGALIAVNCNFTHRITLTDAAASVRIQQSIITEFSGLIFSGSLAPAASGTVFFDELSMGGTGALGTWSAPPGLVFAQLESVPAGSYIKSIGAGPFVITSESNLVQVGGGAGFLFTLPPAAHRTGPIRVKDNTVGGGGTVGPAAGGAINGVAAAIAIPAGGVTLVSDGIVNWETFA